MRRAHSSRHARARPAGGQNPFRQVPWTRGGARRLRVMPGASDSTVDESNQPHSVYLAKKKMSHQTPIPHPKKLIPLSVSLTFQNPTKPWRKTRRKNRRRSSGRRAGWRCAARALGCVGWPNRHGRGVSVATGKGSRQAPPSSTVRRASPAMPPRSTTSS
jgi:hypothetical protein